MSLHSKRTELKMKRNTKLFSHVDIYLLVVLVPVPALIQLHCITIIDIVKSEHTTLLVLQALSHHRIKTESNRFKFDSYDGWLRSIANSRKSEIRIFFLFRSSLGCFSNGMNDKNSPNFLLHGRMSS